MRLVIVASLSATALTAEPLAIPMPAPLSTVPVCVEAASDWIDVVYVIHLPDVARIEVLSGSVKGLPSWQVTPVGLQPGGALIGEGGSTAMLFDPPLRAPVRLVSALATGPGLGPGAEGVTFAAYSRGGEQALGPALRIVTDASCP